jgi:4-amino-4-deoxy-L-arabinose transferase-like glycosyltransferase
MTKQEVLDGERDHGDERRAIDLPLVLILLGSAALRLMYLSYSHFQGDEIKALYPPGAPFPEFLFVQKKGPVQFLVTLLVRSVTGGYSEWITRFPFALASLVGVYVLYLLVRDTFGRSPALFSAALVGSCGLLAAFGRIVQYQSFCILFVLLTAYSLFRWLRTGDSLLLYPGLLSYALALLTHYDALTFAPTLGVLLVVGCRRHKDGLRSTLTHLTIGGVAGVILVGLFYIPYMWQPGFPGVRAYLLTRVASGWGLRTFPLTSDLLGLYLPPFYLTVMVPLLVYGAIELIRSRRDLPGLAVVFWFLTTFTFYMLLGGDPRSHVYTYFLPGLILAGLGMDRLVASVRGRSLTFMLPGLAWTLITVSGGVTYYMLVDHAVEHPWYRKTVLGYPLPNLESRRIEGVFGFPYKRGLPGVGELYRSGRLQGSYESNERDVMADYYFGARRSTTSGSLVSRESGLRT